MTAACPYCRAPFEPDEEQISCEVCATPHHADCYAENGGCTVFGCSKAPVDEPKISVSVSDFTSLSRPVPPAPSATPTPPPPRPGSTTPPPLPTRTTVVEDKTRYLTPPQHLSLADYSPQPVAHTPARPYVPRRSRLTYILLGIFLGAFGGHNFYAGYTTRAVIQLLITLLTFFFGSIISWIWAVVEVCIVKQDADGDAFI
jgi:TM2 domain-containing membrane protein YozV